MNINLIGMRGVGKSNVARRLSVLTKRPVMSTDVLIEYESGLPVPQFVESRGWRDFRDLEFTIIAKLAEMDGIIVDCGGGALVDLDAAGDERVEELRDEGPGALGIRAPCRSLRPRGALSSRAQFRSPSAARAAHAA